MLYEAALDVGDAAVAHGLGEISPHDWRRVKGKLAKAALRYKKGKRKMGWAKHWKRRKAR